MPTRKPPYRYGVTFQCRDGTSKTLGVNTSQQARRMFTDLTYQVGVVRVEWRDAKGNLIKSTRDSTCAGCAATIGGQDGRLMLGELPFCGVCTSLVGQSLLEGDKS